MPDEVAEFGLPTGLFTVDRSPSWLLLEPNLPQHAAHNKTIGLITQERV
ncbi:MULTISPECIES: hypothetical protein [unclassified Mycobacterium]|nr:MULTISPECIES: hypothetical protein [unclassified Mycobacterium]